MNQTIEYKKQKLEELAAKIKRVFGKIPEFKIEIIENKPFFSIIFSSIYFSMNDILRLKRFITKKQWEYIQVQVKDEKPCMHIIEIKAVLINS